MRLTTPSLLLVPLEPAVGERIARRYMDDELAESYGRRNAVPPEMVIRQPTKITAKFAVAD